MNKEQCIYYGASRSQRESEIKRGLGTDGTHSYEVVGCYKCDGSGKRETQKGICGLLMTYEILEERAKEVDE